MMGRSRAIFIRVVHDRLQDRRKRCFSRLPLAMYSYISSRWAPSQQQPMSSTRFGWLYCPR
jgi:hypothetical protein